MKHHHLYISCLLCLFAKPAKCQSFVHGVCDSINLSGAQLEKCKGDSIFNQDIVVLINYYTILKTGILPKYRIQRRRIVMSASLEETIKVLKRLYDSVLNVKLNTYESDMDRNQLFVQPKAYIASLLSFQSLRFYPDVYAILLNEIHLGLKPKTRLHDLVHNKELFDQVISLVPSGLYKEVVQIITALEDEKAKYTERHPTGLFSGLVPGNYKEQYDVINFLLWNE